MVMHGIFALWKDEETYLGFINRSYFAVVVISQCVIAGIYYVFNVFVYYFQQQ